MSSKLSRLDRSPSTEEPSAPRRPTRLPDGGRPLLAAEDDDPDADRLSWSASSPLPAEAESPRLKADLSSRCILPPPPLLAGGGAGPAWSSNGTSASGSGWSVGMGQSSRDAFSVVSWLWWWCVGNGGKMRTVEYRERRDALALFIEKRRGYNVLFSVRDIMFLGRRDRVTLT